MPSEVTTPTPIPDLRGPKIPDMRCLTSRDSPSGHNGEVGVSVPEPFLPIMGTCLHMDVVCMRTGTRCTPNMRALYAEVLPLVRTLHT